jgi:hypothetical protein
MNLSAMSGISCSNPILEPVSGITLDADGIHDLGRRHPPWWRRPRPSLSRERVSELNPKYPVGLLYAKSCAHSRSNRLLSPI